MTFEECDERLSAGWHVPYDDCCDYASGQRKRYIRSENELRLLARKREVKREHASLSNNFNLHSLSVLCESRMDRKTLLQISMPPFRQMHILILQ